MQSTFLLSILFAVLCHVYAEEKFTLPSNCALSVHRGTECATNQSSIRYHMDPSTLTCLAFKHNGCGGNANSFATKADCHHACIPMDFLSCPANSEPIRREDGSAHCQNGPIEKLECPKGAICSQGFAVGICCDAEVREKVNANYKPDCGPSKKLVKSEQFGFMSILLGKSCEHSFCPEDSECRMGAFFAYCCH